MRIWDLSGFVTEARTPEATATTFPPAPDQIQYTNAKVLLVGDTGTPGIRFVDWEYSGRGDAAWDLAYVTGSCVARDPAASRETSPMDVVASAHDTIASPLIRGYLEAQGNMAVSAWRDRLGRWYPIVHVVCATWYDRAGHTDAAAAHLADEADAPGGGDDDDIIDADFDMVDEDDK